MKKKRKNYYKPVRVYNFRSKNYIGYESDGEKNKNYQLKSILIKLDHI